ncbi:hypothetical protein [Salinisphaera sp. T31B1]|uniref:hypothetical protein n=1 Tax=Salinisphaera sp. T31B1 TaxID=727963 RepID=UPI0033417D86
MLVTPRRAPALLGGVLLFGAVLCVAANTTAPGSAAMPAGGLHQPASADRPARALFGLGLCAIVLGPARVGHRRRPRPDHGS